MKHTIIFLSLSFLLSGCHLINPYENDFSCPDTFHGKCISVNAAYEDSLTGNDMAYNKTINSCIGGSCPDNPEQEINESKQKVTIAKAGTVEDRNYNAYKSSLYTRFDQLLREPQSPVVVPPKVMRVLFLPYRGQEGEFYMYRHIYFFVDDPKWILGDGVEADE